MRKTYLLTALLILTLILCSVLITSAQEQEKPPARGRYLTEKQNGLILTSIDGNTTMTLGELSKNKALVINFWASWCPPCRLEMPGFQKLYDTFKENENIIFVFADTDGEEDISGAKRFLKQNKLNLPIYIISNEDSHNLFRVSVIPTTIIANKHGMIIVYETGYQNWNSPEMVTLIRRLIK